jgi:hypothetical protein
LFSTGDNILKEVVQNFIQSKGCNFYEYKKKDNKAIDLRVAGGKSNVIWQNLSDLGLTGAKSGDKFIPQKYKVSSVEDRRELLAGLLDTDGGLSHNGFDFISKSQRLAQDVVFVAQSLGLSAYAKECKKSCQNNFTGVYHRVSISGNTDIIPTKLERKKAQKRIQKKNNLVTGFSVTSVGAGEYFGFEVDKDNLYIMEDFFVTHNSGKSMALVHLGAQALLAGLQVVHYTLELADTVVASRYDSCLTGIPLTELQSSKDDIEELLKNLKGKLIVKEYPTKSASSATIKNHLKRIVSMGQKVDMIIVDYGDLLAPTVRYKEKRTELESIYEELRALAMEFVCPIWTASQTNRCFSSDTTIYKQDGNSVFVSEIKVGDKVETICGFKEVIDTCKSTQKVYKITLKNGQSIVVSDKHVFPTTSEDKSILTGLKVGDSLLVKQKN